VEYLKIGMDHNGTSPYHPRTNSNVERLNRILEGILSKLLFQKPTNLWDRYLNAVLYACSKRLKHCHSTSSTVASRFYSGTLIKYYPSIHRRVILPNIFNSFNPFVRKPQSHRTSDPAQRKENGMILLYRIRLTKETGQEGHNNFESTWFGPYQIVQKMLLGTYCLQGLNGKEFEVLMNYSEKLLCFPQKNHQLTSQIDR
jgi:hypothetical protein